MSRSTPTSPKTRSASIASNRGGDVVLLALAWRNIWRNRRRTLITLAALTLGTFGIVAMHSWRESIFTQLAQSITAQLVGDIQVHGKGYQASPELSNLVKDPIALEAQLA